MGGRPTRETEPHAALLWNYRFRQTFYSDDTAQYLLQSALEGRLPLGARSNFSLRWNYLRPYGYSPLGLDRTGVYNLLSGGTAPEFRRLATWRTEQLRPAGVGQGARLVEPAEPELGVPARRVAALAHATKLRPEP
jgi:hypothetical protein